MGGSGGAVLEHRNPFIVSSKAGKSARKCIKVYGQTDSSRISDIIKWEIGETSCKDDTPPEIQTAKAAEKMRFFFLERLSSEFSADFQREKLQKSFPGPLRSEGFGSPKKAYTTARKSKQWRHPTWQFCDRDLFGMVINVTL